MFILLIGWPFGRLGICEVEKVGSPFIDGCVCWCDDGAGACACGGRGCDKKDSRWNEDPFAPL